MMAETNEEVVAKAPAKRKAKPITFTPIKTGRLGFTERSGGKTERVTYRTIKGEDQPLLKKAHLVYLERNGFIEG